MSNEELKEAVVQASEALKVAIANARAQGITVNLWVAGSGPTGTGKSQVNFDFGNT
jgi:hypothetical protein